MHNWTCQTIIITIKLPSIFEAASNGKNNVVQPTTSLTKDQSCNKSNENVFMTINKFSKQQLKYVCCSISFKANQLLYKPQNSSISFTSAKSRNKISKISSTSDLLLCPRTFKILQYECSNDDNLKHKLEYKQHQEISNYIFHLSQNSPHPNSMFTKYA